MCDFNKIRVKLRIAKETKDARVFMACQLKNTTSAAF